MASRTQVLTLCWFCGRPSEDREERSLQPVFGSPHGTGPRAVAPDRVTVCAECVRALYRDPRDDSRCCTEWIARIAMWHTRTASHGEKEPLSPPGCWFSLLPLGAPVRLFAGLPLLELFSRGWVPSGRYRIGRAMDRLRAHVDQAYLDRIREEPSLGSHLEKFASMARDFFDVRSEDDVLFLASVRPKVSDFAISWFYGYIAWRGKAGVTHGDTP